VRFLHIEVPALRTNIEIDDQLIHRAMRSSGARTKRAAVEAGLQLLVKTHSQTAMRKLRGKVQWEGDLSESRPGRVQE
jgi:Arc/MetJ family transcription regulator